MIIPAVIPNSLSDLKEKFILLNFTKNIQIDVVDGKFDDDISWPFEPKGEVGEAKDLLKDKNVEVDLMVKNPVSHGRDWLLSGASRLIFHLESVSDFKTAVLLRKEFDFSLGISISNQTPLESLYEHIDDVDFVQLMGIEHIGSQGEPFYEDVLQKIVALRHLFPKITISVDGGINESNLEALKKAGANRFVIGSNILKAKNPENQYEKLLKISTQK